MKRRRVMLSPVGEGDSYMVIHVSPDNGAAALKLADCTRIIQWYFGRPGSRKTIRKIKRVKAIVDQLHDYLTGAA